MFVARDDGPVRTLTITNPERRNAIPGDQWKALAEGFADFERSAARALIIVGEGEHFCSGADLAAGFEGRFDSHEVVRTVSEAASALHRLTKPTVAAVDGFAVGAGLNLALGCDVLIATDRARFSEVFVRRGLTVDFGGTWLLPRRVGLAHAKELALTGRVFDAAEAERIGMVSLVVGPDRLDEVAHEVAAELAAGAPLAQRFIKAGLDRSFEMSFDEALSYEHAAQALLLSTEDVAEGLAAFLQKRPPEFKGR